MKRYLITRVYNNLPSNNKNNELSNICRKFLYAELTEFEYNIFVEEVQLLVARSNEKYPRTTPLWVRKWTDGISVALNGSDKSLSITATPIMGNYEMIKAAIYEV